MASKKSRKDIDIDDSHAFSDLFRNLLIKSDLVGELFTSIIKILYLDRLCNLYSKKYMHVCSGDDTKLVYRGKLSHKGGLAFLRSAKLIHL